MIKNGICEFCGQAVLKDECDCPAAKQEAKTLKKIEEANESIDMLFVKEAKQLDLKISAREIALLKSSAELLANGLIKSAAFDFFGGVKAKLALDAADNIKITRTKSTSDTQTIKD
ncbi:MAG: hypothetical protein IJ731_06155 [Eubacterium sp.]|nr:hypothetical protein [Eubacterium sp.]